MILLGSSDTGAIKYLKAIKFNRNIKIKLIKNKNEVNKIKKYKKKIKIVVTGSAQGDSIDKKILKFSNKEKIFSISVIEHWTNYKSRFKLGNKYIFPNIIFVNDLIAYRQAIKAGLPKKKLKIIGNTYFETLFKKSINKKLSPWAKNIKSKYRKIIVFVSENIKGETGLKKDYTTNEYETLEKLINNIKKKDILIVKCHPNEFVKKYKNYKNRNLIIKKKINFEDLVNLPDLIIGMKSNFLLELAVFRRDIISYRPKKDASYIGEKLKIIKLVRKNLRIYLYKKKILNKKFFNYFQGSSKNISNFIEKIYEKK